MLMRKLQSLANVMQEMTKHLMLITLQYSWVQRAGDDGLVWARNGDPGR